MNPNVFFKENMLSRTVNSFILNFQVKYGDLKKTIKKTAIW